MVTWHRSQKVNSMIFSIEIRNIDRNFIGAIVAIGSFNDL